MQPWMFVVVVLVPQISAFDSQPGSLAQGPALGAVSTAKEGTRSNVVEWVAFDDMIQALPDRYEMQTSWDCIGHQPESSYVYLCMTTWKNTDSQSLFANQDTLVFRYNTDTKERTFIGTFMEAAKRAGNLWKGEIIPKGHTHISYADGHMWIGAQNFHDFEADVNMTELDSYHGGHLFSINTETLEIEDATAKHCPNGVAVDHEGIVAQSVVPEMHWIVGLTHPWSNLVLFNYKTRQVEKVVKGIPWEYRNPLGREIVALPNGHVYLKRWHGPVWMYDHSTGKMGPTNVTMNNGFWDSHAYKKDGSGIYLATCLGSLWYMDTRTEKWSSLGMFLPQDLQDAGTRIVSMYTIALTPEEDKLYGIVNFYEATPNYGGDVFVKDLKSGQVSFVQNLLRGKDFLYTGSGVTVGNSMYFSRAGPGAFPAMGNVSLGILRFGAVNMIV